MSSLHLLKCSGSVICRLPNTEESFSYWGTGSECWQAGEYEKALMYDSRLIDKQLKPAFSLLTSLVPLSQPSLSCQTFRLKLSKHLDEIYSPAFGQKRMLNVQTWKILLKPFLRFEKKSNSFRSMYYSDVLFSCWKVYSVGMQVQYITYTLKHKFCNLYHECWVFRHARVRPSELCVGSIRTTHLNEYMHYERVYIMKNRFFEVVNKA